jgi:hypothetical protein
MLTFESRGAGVRTSLLSLTRGEGGRGISPGYGERQREIARAEYSYGTDGLQ